MKRLLLVAVLALPFTADAQQVGPPGPPLTICEQVGQQYGAVIFQQTVTIKSLQDEARDKDARIAQFEAKDKAAASPPAPKAEEKKK